MKFFSIVCFSLPLVSGSINAREPHGTVPINSYNYTALGGPLNWYGLDPTANSACAEGSHQSPIDIVTDSIDHASPGTVNLNITNVPSAEFENLGTTVEVVITNGSLVANGTTYTLAQFHFHTPSEHRINEEYYPMEAHFVFGSKEGQIAVVAFLIELALNSDTTPLLSSVFASLSNIKTPGTYTETGSLDFTGIVQSFNNHDIYTYSGSLTTPPCSENVLWFISSQPLWVSAAQYRAVKGVLKFNARYTQDSLGQPNLLEVAASELH